MFGRDDDSRHRVNVRDIDILGAYVGSKLVTVTQHDLDEYQETGAFVCMHFDNGLTVTFYIGDDGFDVETP